MFTNPNMPSPIVDTFECGGEEYVLVTGQYAQRHELINDDLLLEEAKICDMKPLSSEIGKYIASYVSIGLNQGGLKIKPAGHIALVGKSEDPDGKLFIEIGGLLVLEEHRGKGVAQAMIGSVMQQGNYQHGYSNYYAKCNDDSARTFDAVGFRYHGDTCGKYVFKKSIGGIS